MPCPRRQAKRKWASESRKRCRAPVLPATCGIRLAGDAAACSGVAERSGPDRFACACDVYRKARIRGNLRPGIPLECRNPDRTIPTGAARPVVAGRAGSAAPQCRIFQNARRASSVRAIRRSAGSRDTPGLNNWRCPYGCGKRSNTLCATTARAGKSGWRRGKSISG